MGASGVAGAGGERGEGGEGGAAPSAPCDASEVPTEGVFVDARPERGDDTHPGSQFSPLRTIGRAVAVAVEQGQSAIFLAPGTYSEALDVRAEAGPLPGAVSVPEGTSFQLQGGWQFDGARWERDCDPTAREKTVIASTTARGLALQGRLGTIALRTLSVVAGPAPSTPDVPGDSSYGLFASGDGLRVRLEDAIVQASSGARGGEASPGVTGVGVVSCDVYACGSGASGTNASANSPAGAGLFATQGFVPGDGGEGEPGGAASPGTLGSGQLENCGKCVPFCDFQPFTVQAQGSCGCPGASGGGGRRGRGGGASIALFAAGQNAEVTLAYTTLRALDGGNGSPGGEGGEGANGGIGAVFAGANCCLTCTQVGGSLLAEAISSKTTTTQNDNNSEINACICSETQTLPAQPAGGPGGRGGHGGKGGGGSGGPSFALLRTSGVTFKQDQSVLSFGHAGLGAPGASDGEAGSSKELAPF